MFHYGRGLWSFECSTMACGSGAMNVPLWHGAVALSGTSVQCGIYAIGKKPVCAPSIFFEASPTLPLTQFQCWSDWP